jgi:hypothetical protein
MQEMAEAPEGQSIYEPSANAQWPSRRNRIHAEAAGIEQQGVRFWSKPAEMRCVHDTGFVITPLTTQEHPDYAVMGRVGGAGAHEATRLYERTQLSQHLPRINEMFQDLAEEQNIDAFGREGQFQFFYISRDDRVELVRSLCGGSFTEFHAAAPATLSGSESVG